MSLLHYGMSGFGYKTSLPTEKADNLSLGVLGFKDR